jgi:hypothetical protein
MLQESTPTHYKQARQSENAIEIGLEDAPFVVFVYFFPHLNMQKNLLIMGPNNTKNSSKSVIFSYLVINNFVRILLYCKNTHQI